MTECDEWLLCRYALELGALSVLVDGVPVAVEIDKLVVGTFTRDADADSKSIISPSQACCCFIR